LTISPCLGKLLRTSLFFMHLSKNNGVRTPRAISPLAHGF